ncbi:MAG: hypothetical protein JST92_27620, partial [Deltaproteobacteria bacterium]|nr:hypothetical protein [Deltaproteobacteria bacterium]
MNALALALVVAVMPQPWGSQLHGASRVIVLGLPTCGKSVLAEKLASDAHRALFYTPTEDYAAPGRLVLKPRELLRWPKLLEDPHARIVVHAEAEDEEG